MSKQLIELLPVLVPLLYCTLSFLVGGVLAGIIWYRRGVVAGESKTVFEKRHNKQRKFGSTQYYWLLKHNSDNYLFTYNDLIEASYRAAQNPEDCK